ncbi:MAG: amidohydrolase [Paracoccaceae bacterium]
MNLVLKSAIVLQLLASTALAQQADAIYSGGNILTMNDAQPVVEAVAIKDGEILAVGDLAGLLADHGGEGVEAIDLDGATMMPGFIDPHSHFINSLAMGTQVNVSAPPVGPASTPDEIVATLVAYVAENPVKDGDTLLAYGYDDTLMPEGDPLTRDQLDAAFPDTPVMVQHVSLHGAVLNSAAFEAVGYDENTETPEGGIILRREGSNEPLGLVMETAWIPLVLVFPTPGPDELAEQIKAGQMIYAEAGVTTAHEGATSAAQVATLQGAAADGALFIDIVAYPFITELDAILADNPAEDWRVYNNRLKLGGCKATTDGSPQGRTALFTTPYLQGGPAGEENWVGEPTFPQDMLNKMVKTCYDLGLPMNLHANGDGAIDMVLAAHEFAAGDDLDADRRTTVIHSQFVRQDQLEKYVEYNILASFYTEHTFFFSAAHLVNRGEEQTARISPMRDAIDMGIHVTNHTDFNVVPIDQLLVVETAVTRKDRNGDVIGPEQRITPLEALKAVTINAAYQYFEEDSKGSIEVGKLADFVVLGASPLDVAPDDISEIEVLQTIKEGQTIYSAAED